MGELAAAFSARTIANAEVVKQIQARHDIYPAEPRELCCHTQQLCDSSADRHAGGHCLVTPNTILRWHRLLAQWFLVDILKGCLTRPL